MMKKTFYSAILLLTLFCSNSMINAQAFEEGKSYVSGSYGFGTFFGLFLNSFKTSLQQSNPSADLSKLRINALGPIGIKYEYAVSEKIGLGVNFSYLDNNIFFNYDSTGNDNITRNYSYKVTRSTFSILARMNVHFGDDEKLDPYFGFGMGYRRADVKINTEVTPNDPNFNSSKQTLPNLFRFPFGFETTFGVRYLFTPNVGAFAEVGFAKSFAQFGLTGKF